MSLVPPVAHRPLRRRAAMRGAYALLFVAASAGCADLAPLEASRCGNGVVEPERGEDCDGFARDGAACRPAGSVGECRLDCSAAGSRCPAGMGCGQDGLCRAPSPHFETWGPTIDGSILRLMSADFDGDGRGDLLGVSSGGLTVSYFDPTGLGVKTTRIPSQASIPAIGDLTEDGIDDIVQPIGAGLGVLQGSADRTLSPIAFANELPGAPTLVSVDADSAVAGEETLVLSGMVAVLAHAGDGNAPIAKLPRDASELAPRVAVGRFDPALGCEEVALAWKKAGEVVLLAPCKQGKAALSTKVELPPDAVVHASGGVASLRVDADEHLDLVIWTSTASGPEAGAGIAIAFGQGDGTFASTPPGVEGGVAGVAVDYAPALANTVPLAVGHLNDDAALDFVSPRGVHVSSVDGDAVTYRTVLKPQVGPDWDSAVIADFNGNGVPDVATACSKTTGLDFYNGAGGGMFNYAKVPTTGALAHLAVGDFDGDLLTDLAVDERGSSEVGGDSLSVLFGQAAGAPTQPVPFGRLGQIGQVLAQDTLQPGQDPKAQLDATTDLVVVSYADAASTTGRLSFFAGNASRLLESAFFIRSSGDAAASQVAVPRHAVAGRFEGEAHLDVTAAGRAGSDPDALWLLRASGPADLALAGTPGAIPDGLINLEDAHIVPVDLGAAGGLESLVLLTPWQGGDDPTRASALVVATSNGKAWSYDEPQLFGEQVARDDGFGGRAIACDVDGDGRSDVLVATATDRGTPGAAFVLWNDGNGGLDFASRTLIPNPDPTATADAAGDDGRVTSVACLRAGRDGAPRLVVLLAGGVYGVQVDPATRKVVGSAKLFERTGEPLEGGVDCTGADVDGDGLDDLSIADAAGIHIYRTRPEIP